MNWGHLGITLAISLQGFALVLIGAGIRDAIEACVP